MRVTQTFYTKEDRARIRISFLIKSDDIKNQIQHCISQLKRFSLCIENDNIRAYQFFYNLGRLQELLSETTYPSIWWKPIEELILEGKHYDIPKHIDVLRRIIRVPYDKELIEKGC